MGVWFIVRWRVQAASAPHLSTSEAQTSEYMVSANASGGYLNMRSSPGIGHGLACGSPCCGLLK
jgi:hypothetical protein